MMMGGGGSIYPFTLSQWQELELQALVFRYMAAGIPVPSDLVVCIRRRLFVDRQTLPFLPNPPPIGWGAYQMDAGARKAMDAEPGRCRRTDGKKWRCSKEAYPDSKYCERHMHRGKSRSRKPVELSLATSPVSSHCSSNFSRSAFPFSCSSSARPPAEGYSRHKDSTNLSLDPLPLSTDNFSSKGGRETPCRAQIRSSIQNTDSLSRILVSEEEMEKHYFLSCTDRRTDSPAKLEEEQPRPFHCFLDEKPPKNEDPWMSMNLDSKTRLSISLPVTNHGMPMIASQCYNDG
ncbi:growth-regulating factor 1-like isoform X2 [Zingiber officinale]|uniref:growth-regulating factor 1-like isoform X2 n=1 Tax=Zingiber officinale TaxID=94328 RepID=UPI001C4C6C12|nr:growth-regulating factor 1-like isoform X2 [Zingiber officinale]